MGGCTARNCIPTAGLAQPLTRPLSLCCSYDHNGKLVGQAGAARTVGTTVAVRDLFKRLPVRWAAAPARCMVVKLAKGDLACVWEPLVRGAGSTGVPCAGPRISVPPPPSLPQAQGVSAAHQARVCAPGGRAAGICSHLVRRRVQGQQLTDELGCGNVPVDRRVTLLPWSRSPVCLTECSPVCLPCVLPLQHRRTSSVHQPGGQRSAHHRCVHPGRPQHQVSGWEGGLGHLVLHGVAAHLNALACAAAAWAAPSHACATLGCACTDVWPAWRCPRRDNILAVFGGKAVEGMEPLEVGASSLASVVCLMVTLARSCSTGG